MTSGTIDDIQQACSRVNNLVKRSNLPGKVIGVRAEACLISFSIMRTAEMDRISDNIMLERKISKSL